MKEKWHGMMLWKYLDSKHAVSANIYRERAMEIGSSIAREAPTTSMLPFYRISEFCHSAGRLVLSFGPRQLLVSYDSDTPGELRSIQQHRILDIQAVKRLLKPQKGTKNTLFEDGRGQKRSTENTSLK
ncbi:hypothetical protein KIN20_018883 [Parelaphostrongylus tenuis]|uniref:Uncharacterized protein n=1 Tax=Parelaphostrongylus tenuis TaxID=148309 RepID=A0AAD5N2I8_PARTN|nr:hypothetical protein KIN20_018883 [Parelaphostrongylus tenuis]